MASRSKRILKVTAIAVLCGAVAVGGTVTWFFARALPCYKGEQTLRGLSAPVHVYRDAYAVPHIFAGSMNDAARTLGYLHASERLFQMEMQRRAGQGRLSEMIGEDLLGVDKFVRTLGLYTLAESSYAAMSPEAQAYFQAYADGVNAWLTTHKNRLPPEFLLLGAMPEPWQPADSVVWGKLMALQLSHNYKLELLRGQLAQKLSPDVMQALFPLQGADYPVTTKPHVTATETIPQPQPEHSRNILQDPATQLGLLTGLDHGASNEWVIAGSRTDTGKPILANDPHLSLEAPILWYLARIVTSQMTVKGATVPGLPIVLLGQNDHIAWGFTTTGSDVQDLFVETIDPNDASHYLTPDGPAAFDTRTEVIHVKKKPDVTLTVRTTRHGPIMSDIDSDMAAMAGEGKVMALSFTGLGATDKTSEALMNLNRAISWEDFRGALHDYQAPPQNVVYADTDGNIGFINPGLVPVRKSGDGLLPADGANGASDWTGYVPFDDLPQLYNPAAGFLFNANNAVVDGSSPHFFGTDWEEPYRAARLQQFFDSLDRHSLDTTAHMQADHLSLVAEEFLPLLASVHSDHPLVTRAVALLQAWDGTMDKNRAEPLLFEAWLYQIHRLAFDAAAHDALTEKGPYSATTLLHLLRDHPAMICVDGNCGGLLTDALQQAVAMLAARHSGDIAGWRWGHEHQAILTHKLYSHVPVLNRLSDLSIASSGDFYTLDRGGSFEFDPDHPFARTHGGGFRGIYDLADPDRSRFMITTGQSGNILSRHYGDLVPLWNDVKAITLRGSEAELQAEDLPVLTLTP